VQAKLHTDGGARGNPGPAGIGVVLTDTQGNVIAEVGEGIGSTTNNVAEYSALIRGLEMALEKGVTEIDVRVDSQLIASQVMGEWKIKQEHLRPLAVKARSLLNRFERSTISHVPREQNAEADKLANPGMDAAMLDAELDAEMPDQGSLLE
jgi:ribonuclease HI